jgi:hypothetical protein
MLEIWAALLSSRIELTRGWLGVLLISVFPPTTWFPKIRNVASLECGVPVTVDHAVVGVATRAAHTNEQTRIRSLMSVELAPVGA